MTTVPTLTLPRKPARPQETRVAPRPHVRMAKANVPLRRPVPDDPEVAPFEVMPIKRLLEQRRKDWDEMGVVESGLCVGYRV